MVPPYTPRQDGFVMPAEWAPHSRCWIAWPVREDLWGDRLQAAREAYADVASTIAQYEPVTVIASPEAVADVSLLCGSGVRCVAMEHDDSWMRDSGPTFVADGAGNLAGVDWIFNGWGERYTPYDRDAALTRALLERLELPRYASDLVMEGGAIHTDGEGTLLTTEAVVFDQNRNGHWDRPSVERAFGETLSIDKVIWLNGGLEDDDTGGHVDNIACFVRPGVVLALTTNDKRDGNYTALQENLERLRSATDARGRRLEVIEVEQPRPRAGDQGQRLALSYVNFYLANGAVIVPAFEDPKDEAAASAIGRAFPKRELVEVPALDIVHGGGGIHCVTQQQPKGAVG